MVAFGASPLSIIVALISCIWLTVMLSLMNEIELEVSCMDNVPTWVCTVGNTAGLFSSYLWSVCLIPQIWQNCVRQSTQGLSLRWAIMNVMAALINLNFVLRMQLPLYVTISAVYMPILEMVILLQFARHSPTRTHRFIAFVLSVILIMLAVVVVLQWEYYSQFTSYSEWVAIALWSLESFPQLWLNAYRQSTTGQASSTVVVTFLGKTTDFASMVCLNLPYQFQVMAYFSTCSAYVNIAQFCYFNNEPVKAALVAGMIIAYSVIMITKLGWFWALALCSVFVIILVGGYRLELCLFHGIGTGGTEHEEHGDSEPLLVEQQTGLLMPVNSC